MGKLPNNQPPLTLIRAVSNLAKPLVRLLLHFQVTFPIFSQMLRQVYVDVADREFGLDDKAPTDSRISLLTGIHRKDVKRLRQGSGGNQQMPEVLSIGTQMIGTWLADPDYLDEAGNPRPLPKSLSKSANKVGVGGKVSFETLVVAVAKQDIRPKVVLDEWLRLGIVHLHEEKVALNTAAFVPQQGFDEKAFFFGKNLHDHIAAGAHNLLGGKPPQVDRAVFYNNLSAADISELEKMINGLASDLLVKVNRQAKSLQEASQGKTDACYRFNLGAYFWVDNQQSVQDDQAMKNAGGEDE
jgi:hypothetical protein